MSKRTIGLIIGLLVITIILLAAALTNVGQTKRQNVTKILPTPTPYAQSILTFSPSQINLVAGTSIPQKVNIMLNTGDDNVTGVQLELSYQPTAFGVITIADGTLFPNPFVIFPPKIDPQEGTISYAYGITPAQQSHTGSGIVGTLTFTPASNPIDSTGKHITQTEIKFLPKSVISAHGIDQSVLNKTTLNNSLIINFVTPAPISSTPSAVAK